MSKNKIIENLMDLIETKNIKIHGMQTAIEIYKKRQSKVVRNLEYLRSRYDSADERAAVNEAINIVKEVYEQI